MTQIDWSLGEYEWTAADLLPAAQELVTAATLRAGERVVDLGSGTGNVALLAAGQGAEVIAIEPAERLRLAAQKTADQRGLSLATREGSAADVPLPDGSVEVLLSNFGLIFAPDAHAAGQELSRVLAPDGRMLFTAWQPGGFLDRLNAAPMRAIRRLTGRSPAAGQFHWHDLDALGGLLTPYGFKVTATQHELPLVVGSPAEYWENRVVQHPAGATFRPLLEQAGVLGEVRSEVIALLEDASPEFSVNYVLIEATR
ncbi:class I SAM-dependent methyltransferase [Kribbella sp. NPDC006257]|uniref:class I SAM-dependent methyltransferase n=1 Tax=Kribbella sp. NPDC006257 TaxID=3156738 RepID=UPI0033BD7839